MAHGEDSQLLRDAQCPMPNAQCPCLKLTVHCYINPPCKTYGNARSLWKFSDWHSCFTSSPVKSRH
jgi:hypothetical protein